MFVREVVMAKLTIQRTWPDGDTLAVEVSAATSYPDALDQARKTAIDTFCEALDISTAEVDEP